jgi:hypothetical protein
MENNVETFQPQGAMLTVDGLTVRVEIESMTIETVSASGPGGSQIIGRELNGRFCSDPFPSGHLGKSQLELGGGKVFEVRLWPHRYFTATLPKP